LLAISLTLERSMAANPRGRRGFWGSELSTFGVSEVSLVVSGGLLVGSRMGFMMFDGS